jgi:hypothetical protein
MAIYQLQVKFFPNPLTERHDGGNYRMRAYLISIQYKYLSPYRFVFGSTQRACNILFKGL